MLNRPTPPPVRRIVDLVSTPDKKPETPPKPENSPKPESLKPTHPQPEAPKPKTPRTQKVFEQLSLSKLQITS